MILALLPNSWEQDTDDDTYEEKGYYSLLHTTTVKAKRVAVAKFLSWLDLATHPAALIMLFRFTVQIVSLPMNDASPTHRFLTIATSICR